MNSRKRHAPDPLPQSRAAKHPRTTQKSPVEADSLGHRWVGLGKELVQLSMDTLKKIVPNADDRRSRGKLHFGPMFASLSTIPSSQEPVPSTSQSQSEYSNNTTPEDENNATNHCEQTPSQETQPPRSLTRASIHNGRVPLPSPPPSDSSVTRSPPKRHSPVKKSPMNTPATKAQSTPGPATVQRLPTELSTSPVTRGLSSESLVPKFQGMQLARTLRDVDFKWPNDYTPHPQVDEALARTPLRPSESRKQKPIKKREHIFEKVHKARVRQEKIKDRVELLKRLYETKCQQGYTGSLVELEGWVSYANKLKSIGLQQPALGPSTDISGDFTSDFLRRALHRAQRTLKSPLAKPYTPTLDQLHTKLRGKDHEIDKKIRPTRPTLPDTLPPQEEARVASLLKQRGVVSKFDREQVTDQDISRLRPGQWLNDEVINFYGAMILARSEACKENPGTDSKGSGRKQPLNIHYFSTFFWTKLTRDGYDKGRLAKWTKKMDIFSKDAILIPVNHNNAHWTAASINFKDKRIESFDSMGMAKDIVFTHLRAYVEAEHRNKKKKPFDWSGWTNYSPDEITPQQENGFDCGVFTCQFLEHLSRGEEDFIFTQKDMPYLRKRMIWEIGNAKLRDDY